MKTTADAKTPAKRSTSLTAAEKEAQKELKAKIKIAEKQLKNKYSQPCKEHGMPTEGGRHELPQEHLPAGWHDTIPGDAEHELLAKPFDYTRHTHVHPNLPEGINANPKQIVINYEHITTPELTIKCAKGEISGACFHHDYLGTIEKSGLIEIQDKVMLPNACYKYRWNSQGAELKPSTFFPAEWTRVQTVEKICESMMPANTKTIEYIGKGKYTHFGLTSDGIPVTSVIKIGENNAKVISAYPDFETYKKFLNGKL